MTIAVIPRESKKNSSERGCSFFLPLIIQNLYFV